MLNDITVQSVSTLTQITPSNKTESYNSMSFLRLCSAFGFLLATATLDASAAQPQVQRNYCELPVAVNNQLLLEPGCIYSGPVEITSSNFRLDCSGATIDAQASLIGILIHGKALRNVIVENCRVDGAKNEGILIRPPLGAREMERLPMQSRYEIAAKDVSIRRVAVINSGNVGVYVGHYAQNTVIAQSRIEGSGGPAIYLDASSVKTKVIGSTLTGNGFGDPLGRHEKRNREAIAIDSSAFNEILDNDIYSNSAGGVFLYKNCWEHHSDPKQARRWQHSSFNTISGNQFKEKIGVWIASRQAKNQSKMDCGDAPLAAGYYRDYADNNTISSNRFIGGEVSVNIQDDNTSVRGNEMTDPKMACVVLGSRKRDELLGGPIAGTELEGNRCTARSEQGFVASGLSTFRNCSRNLLKGTPYACSWQ